MSRRINFLLQINRNLNVYHIIDIQTQNTVLFARLLLVMAVEKAIILILGYFSVSDTNTQKNGNCQLYGLLTV